jgi:hypothetical protein
VADALRVFEFLAQIEEPPSVALDGVGIEQWSRIARVRLISSGDELEDVELLVGVLHESGEKREAAAFPKP